MKTKLIFALCLMFGLGLAGAASASTADQIQPAMDVIYDDNLIVNGTGIFDSIRIGKQDEGGVTFFNGTIVNETTGEGGINNPVTFGDNVRFDGTIRRGQAEGPGDNYPIKIDDDVKIFGNIEWGAKKSVIAVAPFSCMSEQYTSNDEISVHDGAIFPGQANDYYYCPVNLPQNAIVTAFTANVNDATPGSDMIVELYRADLTGNWTERKTMAKVETDGVMGGINRLKDSSINDPVVNNYDNFYALRIDFNSTTGWHQFLGAQVEYKITEPY